MEGIVASKVRKKTFDCTIGRVIMYKIEIFQRFYTYNRQAHCRPKVPKQANFRTSLQNSRAEMVKLNQICITKGLSLAPIPSYSKKNNIILMVRLHCWIVFFTTVIFCLLMTEKSHQILFVFLCLQTISISFRCSQERRRD